jgi:hypothetical protein
MVLGPTSGQSFDVGAIQALAVDPTNGKHVVAGTVNGGIWETLDYTASSPQWFTTTDSMPSLAISSVAFSPVDNTVIYAGTGSYSSGGPGPSGTFENQGGGGDAVGIYKSTNGGLSWSILNPGNIFSGIRVFRIIPTTLNGGQTVFAATTDTNGANIGGIYRSDDGGANWTRLSGSNGLPNTGVTDLAFNPNRDSLLAAIPASIAPTSGIYELALGVNGASWTSVTNNLPAADLTSTAALRIELSVSPAGSNPVWASIINSAGYYQRILRGTYSGGTIVWQEIGPSDSNFSYQPPDIFTGNQGDLHGAILADPTVDNLVYIAGDASTNATGYIVRGDSNASGSGIWTAITPVGSASKDAGTAVPTANGDATSPHADSRALVFDYTQPQSFTGPVLLYACDGGVYQGTNPASTSSGAQVWTSISGAGITGIADTEYFDIAYDSQFQVIFGGSQDNGTPSQTAFGSFAYFDRSTGDGGLVGIDNFTYAGESIRYTQNDNPNPGRNTFTGPNTTADSGGSVLWQSGLPEFTSSAPNDLFQGMVVDAVAPSSAQLAAGQSTRVLAFGRAGGSITQGELYESSNVGTASVNGAGYINDTWTLIPTDATWGSVNIVSGGRQGVIAYGGVANGLYDPDLIYAASGSKIYLRTSAGGTLTATPEQPVGAGAIVAIAVDPTNWLTAYVTDGQQVYETTNAGSSWTKITGNLAIPAARADGLYAQLAVDPTIGALLFGGKQGVFYMPTSAPGLWNTFGTGMPNVGIVGLVYNAARNVIVAGTYGRGAWEMQQPGPLPIAFMSGTTLEVVGFGNNSNNLSLSLSGGTYTVSDSTTGSSQTLTFGSAGVNSINLSLGTAVNTVHYGGNLTGMAYANLNLGSGGSNSLTVDDSTYNGTNTYTFDDITGFQRVYRSDSHYIFYTGAQSISLIAGIGADTVDVLATPAGTTTYLNSAGGQLGVDIGAGTTVGINGPVNIQETNGSSDIVIDDSIDSSFSRNVRLSNAAASGFGAITGITPAEVDYRYADTSSLEIHLGTGNANSVNVLATDAPTTFIGGLVARGFVAQAGAAATLEQLSFKGSTSGGIVNSGSLNIDDCIISGNSSTHNGGGIQNNSTGTINLEDCLVNGNSSSGSGGGVYNAGAMSIGNCTFTQNSATSGPGIYNASGANLQVYNSVLFADSGAELVNHGTASVQSSDVQGGASGAGNLNTNPQFTPNSNFQLQSTSPLIDAGNNTYVQAGLPDLAGNTRIVHGTVDMGAYEFQGPFPSPYLAWVHQPRGVTVGTNFSPNLEVDIISPSGSLATNDNSSVTLTLYFNPAGGQFNNGSTQISVMANGGRAIFPNLSINKVGNYGISVSDGSDTPPNAVVFSVLAAAPITLAFGNTFPGSTYTGTNIGPVIVHVQQNGSTIPSDQSTVILNVQPTGGGSGATYTTSANGGTAIFPNVTFDNPGTYTITAADANPSYIPVSSPSITVTTAPVPDTLYFGPPPTNATQGSPLSPGLVVTEKNSSGNVDTSDSTSTVTLSIAGGTLSGQSSITAPVVNGVATFSSSLSPDANGTYIVTASDGNDHPSALGFSVGPLELVFTTQPQGFAMGSNVPVPAFQVSVEQNGSIVTSDNSTVVRTTVLLPNAAGYSGTLNVQVHNGTATFSNFFVGSLAEEYNVILQATDQTNSNVAPAESTSFSVTPAAAAHLIVSGGGTAAAGTAISPGFQFEVTDFFGDVISTDSSNVTASISSGPAGATLGGILSAPLNVGLGGLELDKAGTYDLLFTDSTDGISGEGSVTITAATATQLSFIQEPSTTATNSPIQPPIVVAAEDAFGNVATGYNGSVVLSIASPSGVPLNGDIAINAQNGLATFNNVEINQVGTYTLLAADSVGTLTTGLSSSFNIVAPAIIYVDQHATGSNNGQSPANAFTLLQSALAAAVPGDTIDVAQGDYSPGGGPTGTFQLLDGVTIQGGFQPGVFGSPNPAAYPTLLDGTTTNYHVVMGSGTDSTAVLDGFTITNGNASGNGDANSGFGGGLFINGGSPTIIDCAFVNNSAVSGGAVYDANDGSTPATFESCIFTNNSASTLGGALYLLNSSPSLVDCLLVGNSASQSAGAIYDVSSSPTITNCTFTMNTAGQDGGAIDNEASNPILTNCILWADTATFASNEISNDAVLAGSMGSSTPVVTYSDIAGGYSGTGNISADPLFVNSAGGNYQLQENSPAIDVGSNNAPGLVGIGLDLGGNLRIIDGVVDMGAYEAQSVGVSWTGLGDGINWSDPNNWSDNQVPTQFDDAIVGSGFNTIDVGSGQYSVHTLNAASPIEIITGTLDLNGASAFSDGITIDDGGELQVASTNSVVVAATGLMINPGGMLNLENNELLISYSPGSDPISAIASYLASGYNNGAWNGPGIDSSVAAANSSSYGLGYADSADPGNPASLAPDTMEIDYTLVGDADLNHVVNGIDFGILAANFNKSVSRWDQGDFTYDNIVNGIDFAKLAANFNKGAVTSVMNGSLQTTTVVSNQQVLLTPTFNFTGVNVTYDGKTHAAGGSVTNATIINLNPLLHLTYKNLANGAFSSAAPQQAGTYEVFASFDGDTYYEAIPSFDTGQKVVIAPATSTFTNLSNLKIAHGTKTTIISGTLSAGSLVPAGTVRITVNGITISAKIQSNGSFVGTFTTRSLKVGSYTISYAYLGSANFAPTTGTGTLRIVQS